MSHYSRNYPCFPLVMGWQFTPHIAKEIFQNLEQNSLAKCRLVSKDWNDFVVSRTTLWRNISTEKYIQAAKEGRLDICSLIVQNVEDKNPRLLSGRKRKHSPKNSWIPSHNVMRGQTPLHSAAQNGHLEVCRLIMNNVIDRNPKDQRGVTPLHLAAYGGHLEVCRHIMESNRDFCEPLKNPKDRWGQTPLHRAADSGHLEVCLLIFEYVQDKNPRDTQGYTPLHIAAERGHLEICRLITSYVEEKHPLTFFGHTPLDSAQIGGNPEIMEYFAKIKRGKL